MTKKRAVKVAVSLPAEERRRSAIRRYAEGYRRKPESTSEIAFAEATATLAFDPEGWEPHRNVAR